MVTLFENDGDKWILAFVVGETNCVGKVVFEHPWMLVILFYLFLFSDVGEESAEATVCFLES